MVWTDAMVTPFWKLPSQTEFPVKWLKSWRHVWRPDFVTFQFLSISRTLIGYHPLTNLEKGLTYEIYQPDTWSVLFPTILGQFCQHHRLLFLHSTMRRQRRCLRRRLFILDSVQFWVGPPTKSPALCEWINMIKVCCLFFIWIFSIIYHDMIGKPSRYTKLNIARGRTDLGYWSCVSSLTLQSVFISAEKLFPRYGVNFLGLLLPECGNISEAPTALLARVALFAFGFHWQLTSVPIDRSLDCHTWVR